MFSIYIKELKSYFSSLIAYIVIVVFLVVTGLITWIGIPGFVNGILDSGYTSLDSLFSIGLGTLLILTPVITMGTFAEEMRTGTIEILLTRPLTSLQIVVGKFLAVNTLLLFAILPTLVYYFSISTLGNIDHAATIGSYIGLLLLGSTYCAIGMFASSLTKSQIVAFLLALTFCIFISIGFDWISDLFRWKSWSFIIRNIGVSLHYNNLSKGLVDFRDVTYFVSVDVIMLLAADLVLRNKK